MSNIDSINFIRSPAKHGWITTIDPDTKEKAKEQTFVFTIPQNYIRSGMIDTTKKYKSQQKNTFYLKKYFYSNLPILLYIEKALHTLEYERLAKS